MTIIKATVNGADIHVSLEGGLTAGMVGVRYEISYDTAWDGLGKIVVFSNGTMTRNAVNGIVPSELLTTPGTLIRMGVVGRKQDGTIVIPTIWTDIGYVLPGAEEGDDPGLEPENPVWAQSAAIAQQAMETVQDLRQQADSGAFKGEKGEPYVHSEEFTALAGQIKKDAESAGEASAAAIQAADGVHSDAAQAMSAAYHATQSCEEAVTLKDSARYFMENAAESMRNAQGEANKAQNNADKAETEARTAKEEADKIRQSISELKADHIAATVPGSLAAEPNIQSILNVMESQLGTAGVNLPAAPVITVKQSGEVIATDILSPVVHCIKCTAKAGEEQTALKVCVYSGNLFDIDKCIEMDRASFVQLPDGFCIKKTAASMYAAAGFQIKLVKGIRYYLNCEIEHGKSNGLAQIGLFTESVGFISWIYTDGKWIDHYFTVDKTGSYNLRFYPDGGQNGAIGDQAAFRRLIVSVGQQEYVPYMPPVYYIPDQTGTVANLKSIWPSMTIMTNQSGAAIEAEYYADTKKYVDKEIRKLTSAQLNAYREGVNYA